MISLVLGLTAPALAADHPAALMDLLNAYEVIPDAATLSALGPTVDADLRAVAEDAAVPPTRRGRAVSALRHFPTDANRTWLESALAGSSDDLIRRKAALALADGWDEAALPAIEATWPTAGVQLRVSLSLALGLIDGSAADAAAAVHLAAERDPTVRSALQQATNVEGPAR
jgi:hypothetical protein